MKGFSLFVVPISRKHDLNYFDARVITFLQKRDWAFDFIWKIFLQFVKMLWLYSSLSPALAKGTSLKHEQLTILLRKSKLDCQQ